MIINSKMQKGFIQMPILIAIIAGVLILGSVGYVEVKQYKGKQTKETQKEENGSAVTQGGTWLDQLDKLDENEKCALATLNQINYLKNEKFFEEFTFDRYKITDELRTVSADLDVNSNHYAKEFKTMIRSKLSENGVNFAGHYSIISVGMTGWGQNYWIVDRINGRAFIFPYLPTFLDFNKNSNLIIMNSKDSVFSAMHKMSNYRDNCGNIGTMYLNYVDARPFYFLWENEKLILLAPKTIGPPINQFWDKGFN